MSTTLTPRKVMSAPEFAVCIATDAFRLCIGRKPRNFTVDDVIRWLRLMEARS